MKKCKYENDNNSDINKSITVVHKNVSVSNKNGMFRRNKEDNRNIVTC